MARVIIEQLSKAYALPGGRAVRALREVSLEVESGELLALVGPSGSGKTTLLRLVAGLEEPSGGTIRIDGQVQNGLPPQARDVAMVFQHHALFPHLTVRENLGLGLKLRKHARAEIALRVKETAEMLGITGLLERKPGELSGGEGQRVALGRALARRPKLFLLDEPLSSLDGPLREQLRGELAQLQQRLGATMIHVTHDQLEAMTLGDRIAVLREGQLQQVADPLHLYRQPANLFTAGFIGSPAMNFFTGTLTANGPEIFFEFAGHCVRLAAEHAAQLRHCIGQRVVLGLRPEDLRIDRLAEAPETGIRARIEAVERLGVETHVRFRLDGHRGVLRAGPDEPAAPNQDLALRFRMDQAHFFDPAHGGRLG